MQNTQEKTNITLSELREMMSWYGREDGFPLTEMESIRLEFILNNFNITN